jgi:hypothetical protein
MSIPKFIAFFEGIAIVLSVPALATGKPKGAKNAYPQRVVQQYANTSTQWRSAVGIFFTPDGKAKALSPTGTAVDAGKWWVTSKGTRCWQVT